MTIEETADVLAMCAAYDSRTVGRADILAWHQTIGDFDLDDARAAVAAWYAEHRERIMPADVRAGVRRIRAARLASVAELEPPDADPDDVAAYIAQMRSGRRRQADGTERPRPVAALVAQVAKTLPSAEYRDTRRST